MAYAIADPIQRLLSGRAERVGRGGYRLMVRDAEAAPSEDREFEAPDQAASADLVVEQVGRGPRLAGIEAVAHRVVHG